MASETELAAKVVAWLQDQHWDVYQEVECYGGRADIVAVHDGRVWIIEVKTSLTFNLIEQAIYRTRCAHWVSVVVPSATRPRRLAESVLSWKGLGLIVVDGNNIIEKAPAKLRRSYHAEAKHLLARLEPEHKTFAPAGTNKGSYWSPFRRTCTLALSYIKTHGPTTAAELMRQIDHHYASPSSAKANFIKLIRIGDVPGLVIERGAYPLTVVLKKENKAQSGRGPEPGKLL
jgi:hypothetical protein